ncbi:MAG: YqjF family protein [Limisphaerales bacterium]
MTWEHLAFLHWRVPRATITPYLPDGLKLDTFKGSAWIGIVPFLMSNVRARGLSGIPTTSEFLELNLRTYVTRDGKPGVWFFSLDAASWLCVRAARIGFQLPYFDADMDASFRDDVAYRSRRTHRDAPPARFRVRYRPAGPVFQSSSGSLEHWLTERYCLYSADRCGRVYRGEIHHRPWPLQACEATVEENTMGTLIGHEFDRPPESVLYARTLQVPAWPIRRIF